MRNMNDILRQAQVMQNKLAKLQNELNERTYEGGAEGDRCVHRDGRGRQWPGHHGSCRLR